jgi:hypothetical protein
VLGVKQGFMIEAGNAEVNRDEFGMWLHPAFPWHEVPEGGHVDDYAKEWGYQCHFQTLEGDAPESVVERYSEANDPDYSYWTPSTPKGEGWFLGAIYDTEDGPAACWMRPNSKTP